MPLPLPVALEVDPSQPPIISLGVTGHGQFSGITEEVGSISSLQFGSISISIRWESNCESNDGYFEDDPDDL